MQNLIQKIAISFLLFFSLAMPSIAYDFSESGIEEFAAGSGHKNIPISQKTPIEIVGFIINILLSFIGIVFLILTIYAGYTWLMARENPAEAEKSRTILKNAILGLILVASAYAITYFITNAIGTSTGLTK